MFARRETLVLSIRTVGELRRVFFNPKKRIIMNPQEFTETYIHTIFTDPTTKETFIKVPIADYQELSYMQQSLLENLHLLTHLEDRSDTDRGLKNCAYWLSKILLASYPAEELEGISKLIKAASKFL